MKRNWYKWVLECVFWFLAVYSIFSCYTLWWYVLWMATLICCCKDRKLQFLHRMELSLIKIMLIISFAITVISFRQNLILTLEFQQYTYSTSHKTCTQFCCILFYFISQVSNIRRAKSQHLKRFSDCLAPVFAESLGARCQVENEDVVGAAPTGDAPTTSDWSTISLPTKVRLVLEILRYLYSNSSD